MKKTLDDIAKDYSRSEITVMWVHDRTNDCHQLLYAVAEVCPFDQEKSLPIKAGDIFLLVREKLDELRTLYITRLFFDQPDDALIFYRGTQGRKLKILSKDGEQPNTICFERNDFLVAEPPSETLLTLPQEPNSLSTGFPRRKSAFRVSSLFDTQGFIRKGLSLSNLEIIKQFSIKYLGFDLSQYPEKIGALSLCFPNPIIKSYSLRLGKNEDVLLFQAYERCGKSIAGCKLELIDERLFGNGFHFQKEIENSIEVIPLPCSPNKLRIVLYDQSGECIEDDTATFLRKISFSFNINSATRKLSVLSKIGEEEVHEIPITERIESTIGNTENLPSDILNEEENRRARELLCRDGTFYYFSGDDNSKTRAVEVLRGLLKNVQYRCLICDPYLSGQDVHNFVPFVSLARLKVQLLSSAAFLIKDVKNGKKEGDLLKESIDSLQKQDPHINIECKVLLGRNTSPVHDRFLIINDDVYLLGSSLNEFGSRATTLFRAPNSEYLRKEIFGWWDNGNKSKVTTLDDWIARRNTSKDGKI